MKKGILFLIFMVQVAQAQDVPMADALREDGKIWVVVASLLIILTGVFYYLWRTDVKIEKLKKEA